MIKQYILLAAVLLLASNFGHGGEQLVLSAPATSEDGSYILSLNSEVFTSRFINGKLELFRNRDGGEFELLVSVPLFKSISQLVSGTGVYGYKVRWASEEGFSEFSEPVFVAVSSRFGGSSIVSRREKRPELTLGAR